MSNQIIVGDCLEVMPSLHSGVAQLIMTSPPYPGQKGDTRTVDEWLAWFSLVLYEMNRILTDNGVLALNVMFKRTDDGWFDTRILTEVPYLLRAHGLKMIDLYHFIKPNPAPNGALTYCDINAWEPVFVATKSRSTDGIAFNQVRKPYRPKSLRANGKIYTTRTDDGNAHPEGARQSNVLIISSSGDQNRPRAEGQSFPCELAERFILQYTNVGDLVVDPFAGVGTTLKVAQKNKRPYIGIEIKESEAAKARQWLSEPYTVDFINALAL